MPETVHVGYNKQRATKTMLLGLITVVQFSIV